MINRTIGKTTITGSSSSGYLKILFVAFCVIQVVPAFGQQPRLVLPKGHTDEITILKFSIDDKLIATGSKDNTVKLWSAENGMLLHNFTGHTDEIKDIIFYPGTKKMLTTASDNTIKIWDLYQNILIADIPKQESGLFNVFLSKDGRIIVALCYGAIKIFSGEDGSLIKTIKHNSIVNSISNRLFADLSDDEQTLIIVKNRINEPEIMVWDLNKGNLLRQIDLDACPWGVKSAFFTDSNTILSNCGGNVINSINVITGKVDTLMSLAQGDVNMLITNKDKNRLLIQCANKQTGIYDLSGRNMVAWPTRSGKKQAVSFGVEQNKYLLLTGKEDYYDSCFMVNTIAGNSTFQYIPAGEDITAAYYAHKKPLVAFCHASGEINICNAATNTTLFVLSSHIAPVNAMYKAGNQYLYTGHGNGTIKKWDIHNATMTSETSASKWIEVFDCHEAEGMTAAGAGDGTINIWNTNDRLFHKTLTVRDMWVSAVAFSPDGKQIAGSYSTDEGTDNVIVWDIASGKKIFSRNGTFFKSSDPFSADSRLVLYNRAANTIEVCQLSNSSLLKSLHPHKEQITSMQLNANQSKLLTTSTDGSVMVTELASGRKMTGINVKEFSAENAVYNNDESQIATISSGGEVEVWDAVKGTKITGWNVGHGWKNRIKYVNSHIVAETENEVFIFDVAANSVRKIGAGEWLDGWKNLRYFSNEEYLALLSPTGSFSLYPIDAAGLPVVFCNIDSDDHLVQIPAGYYSGTRGAAKQLHYVMPGLDVVSFDQLDVKYNRPDKVLEYMGTPDTALIRSYRNAYYKRIKRLGIDTAFFKDGYSIPEADIANRNEISYERTSSSLQLHITGRDSTTTLDRFNVWVNESPLFGTKGISLNRRNKKIIDTNITITLSQGDNIIETSVTNTNGIESYRKSLRINYTPATIVKENVWFIGIGIDSFAMPGHNLQWSATDIVNLQRAFKEKYGRSFHSYTLINKQVTIESVTAFKKLLLDSTTINDKVIIAYSGHGLLSKDFDYYLSAYAINFSDPEQGGIPYDILQNLLDSIPARKKLLLLDACHSGEIDKDEIKRYGEAKDALEKRGLEVVAYDAGLPRIGMKNSFELMQQLFVNVSRGTGATIISAATGTQFALEKGDLKGGVFTYSVLEKLKYAEAMKVGELRNYVGKRVSELTNGLQQPTTRSEAMKNDWKIW